MTTPEHIAGLERRITDMERNAADYDKAALLITGTSPAHVSARKTLRHSAASCRLDADKCRAKIAALQELEAAA